MVNYLQSWRWNSIQFSSFQKCDMVNYLHSQQHPIFHIKLSEVWYMIVAILNTFIASHFNYCSLVWHFSGKTDTQKLERIQYRTFKFVYQDSEKDYSELLRKAHIYTHIGTCKN